MTNLENLLRFAVSEPDLATTVCTVKFGVPFRPLDTRLVNLDALDAVKHVGERDGKQAAAGVGVDEVALPFVARSTRTDRLLDVVEQRRQDRVVVLEEGPGLLLKLVVSDLLADRRVVIRDADVRFGRRDVRRRLGHDVGRSWGQRVSQEDRGAAFVRGDVAAPGRAWVRTAPLRQPTAEIA